MACNLQYDWNNLLFGMPNLLNFFMPIQTLTNSNNE
jgi:hypothetical protein